MGATVTCSNPKCRTTIDTTGKNVGEDIKCPKCGTPNQVLADFQSAFDISTIVPPPEGQTRQHPARQVCPNCGAVLGVRASVCPRCKADIRTGAAAVATPQRRSSHLPSRILVIGGIICVAALIAVAVVAFVLLAGNGP